MLRRNSIIWGIPQILVKRIVQGLLVSFMALLMACNTPEVEVSVEPKAKVAGEPNEETKKSPHHRLKDWVKVTDSAGWFKRYDHDAVTFQNKIWVISGAGTGWERDVWNSADGETWSKVNETSASKKWNKRHKHTVVVFDDQIWIMGGSYSDFFGKLTRFNDVYSSSNGKTWNLVTNSAKWSAREDHAAVVFDDQIWIMGGFNGSYKNDVWSSTNGKDWNLVTSSAKWSVRSGLQSVAFNGKLWVMGGDSTSAQHFNDVWSSTNGKDWNLVTSSAKWSARSEHQSVVLDDQIWVIGGGFADRFKNDVWSSTNGKDWKQLTGKQFQPGRGQFASVVLDNKIWVLGGRHYSSSGSKVLNDVWTLKREKKK